MNVPRKDFLTATTAYTTVNLFHPVASSGAAGPKRWHAVWFQPIERSTEDAPKLEGFDRPIFTLSAHDRWKIRHAKPGGREEERTAHFFAPIDEYIPNENIGLKELLVAVKSLAPDLDKRMTDDWLEGRGTGTVADHIARYVGQEYGIEVDGRKHGREMWEELRAAVEGGK